MELSRSSDRGDDCGIDRSLLRKAFLGACDGFSSDRVVVDPVLNQRFLEECNRHGLNHGAVELNQSLLNARKARYLSGIKTEHRTHFGERQDEWEFASEIAIRFLERRETLSSDRILCDPELMVEFDSIASSLAPGFEPLEYRWAVLSLRKRKQLRPELAAKMLPAATVQWHHVASLDVSTIPFSQGLYLFHAAGTDGPLYVGETNNLQKRIAKHLDHSDNRDLAQWLWGHGSESLQLELHILDPDTANQARKALELELIQSRNPLFNVKGR